MTRIDKTLLDTLLGAGNWTPCPAGWHTDSTISCNRPVVFVTYDLRCLAEVLPISIASFEAELNSVSTRLMAVQGSGACSFGGAGFDMARKEGAMNDKKNQPSQQDSPHSYLASVPRASDVADAGISRRGFLGSAAASMLLAHAEQQPPRSEARNSIPYRTLRRTREKVLHIGLGGYFLQGVWG
jgi:hypothetical protein